MAEVIWLPGSQPPQNEGEARAVEALKQGLPATIKLYPGLQMVQRNRVDDIDVLVLTPWALVVVEIKDLRGSVYVGDRDFYVDDQERGHPALSASAKAKSIHSHLEGGGRDLAQVWVTHLVVLAREPQRLQIVPRQRNRVVSIDRALELLGDARNLLDADRRAERIPPLILAAVQNRLGLAARSRRQGRRFSAYRTSELVAEDDFEVLWRGVHEITGQPVELRHIGATRFQDEERLKRRLDRAKGEIRAFDLMGPHPHIVPTREILPQDDGSMVLVSEAPLGSSLADLLEEGSPLASRRRVLLGLVSALAHAHRAGVVHGRLSPRWVEVRDQGMALLRGFSFSGEPGQGIGATAVAGEDAFFVAPEALAPHPVGPAADLFGLGRIMQRLWPEADGSEESRSMRAASEGLTVNDPARRFPSAAFFLEALEGRREPQPEQPETLAVIRDEQGRIANGSTIGAYLVEEYIGSGSTADLYKASHPMRAAKVALKVFRRDDLELVAREFSILEKLDHPHIVHAVDAGRVEGAGPFIAYEYLDGPTLSQVIDSGPQEEQAALTVTVELLDALAAIHSHGAVHRDVKPENIILVAGRGAVLTDFGSSSDGGDGTAAGTPEYRPPHAPADYAEPDIDLYAVGVMLSELLTGKHPFPGRDPAAGPPDLEGVPAGVHPIVARAIASERCGRYSSAEEFLGAVRHLLSAGPAYPEVVEHTRGLHRRIETLIETGELDEAEAICPENWLRLLAIIARKRAERRARLGTGDLVPTRSGVRIHRRGEERTTFKWTPGRASGVAGRQVTFEVTGADGGILLDVCLRQADNGETWIGVEGAYDSHPMLQRLKHGLTIGFRLIGRGLMTGDLTLAVPKGEEWAGWRKASLEELSGGAGVDVAEELQAVGATAVGRRAEILEDEGRRKEFVATVFPAEEENPPVLAYVLTRVVPLARAAGLLG